MHLRATGHDIRRVTRRAQGLSRRTWPPVWLPRLALHPVHIVVAWHDHDPAVSLSIYSDAKADELRAAGTSLFG